MTLGERVRSREPVIGGWVSLTDPAVAEMTASLGFDFVLLDMEHTTASVGTIADMARAVDATGGDVGSIARVPWNDHVVIKRVLDVGVQGVMAPMIGSAGEARDFVDASRYPPDGIRGVAGTRAADYGLSMTEYVATANESIVTVAQIETEAGLENVAEIATVDGLDALFVGPADLSTALGVFGQYDDEAFVSAIEQILSAAHEVDVPVATLATSTDGIERWIELGFDFVMAGVDAAHVLGGASQALRTAERSFEDRDS